VSDLTNLEALAEALYLASYPYLHQGAPPRRTFQDAPGHVRSYYRYYARELGDLYYGCCKPLAERTVKLRDVNPELWEQIHGKRPQ
jgi:hypothetical protein